MKHLKFLLFIFSLSLIFTGCSKGTLSSSSKILPPENKAIPLQGVWTADKYYDNDSSSNTSDVKKYMGKLVAFGDNRLLFFDNIYQNPSYKIKTVNAKDYFMKNYSINPKELGVNKNTIQILTVKWSENFLTYFAIIDQNTILTYKNGVFFKLSKNIKLSSSIDEINNLINQHITSKNLLKNSVITNHSSDDSQNKTLSHQLNSGILLGLKSYKTPSYTIPSFFPNIRPKQEPVYRTVWLNFIGDSVVSSTDLPFILAPRPNGFWKIESTYNYTDNYLENYLYAYPIGKNSDDLKKAHEKNISKKQKFYSLSDITFIGSDYISIDLTKGSFVDSKKSFSESNYLNLIPLDMLNTSNFVPISIEKILGPQSIEALKEGAANCLNSINYEDKKTLILSPQSNNFGLARKNGKWVLKGRLTSNLAGSKNTFKDFDIPMVPSRELVTYDSLYPSWNVIKERIPDAVDAYSPPNKNFILIITKSKILVYNISNQTLGNKPIKTISLKENEQIIMSQWATGKYTETWNDEVKSLLNKK